MEMRILMSVWISFINDRFFFNEGTCSGATYEVILHMLFPVACVPLLTESRAETSFRKFLIALTKRFHPYPHVFQHIRTHKNRRKP